MSYKTTLLRLTPRWAHRFGRDAYFALRLLPNVLYDTRRFLVHSGLNRSRDHKAEHAARVTLFYHQVEKGLSLASPRPGFGRPVVQRLLQDIEAYVRRHGWEHPATTAVCALRAYIAFNDRAGHDVSAVKAGLARIEASLPAQALAGAGGGTRPITRDELAAQRQASFAAFFNSRYSIRNFEPGTVPDADIAAAIGVAQKTPSVCNRQSWQVHAYKGRAVIQQLMDIQAGGRGFADNIATLLVVTCDLGQFVEVGERYQPWIDGGMFAMSICLALHDQGHGTCCLNWSKEADADRRMRRAAALPDAAQIIMLIAVGVIPPELDVAYSFRPPVERCLTWH